MATNFIQRLLGPGARLIRDFTQRKQPDGPDAKSCDYLDMERTWCTINDILAGADCIRAAGERYLPRFVKESRQAYERRRCHAAWRPEFEDALRSLCSAPFTKPVTLQGEVPPAIEDFVQDVDGQGNN